MLDETGSYQQRFGCNYQIWHL